MSTENTGSHLDGWFIRLVKILIRLIFASIIGLALGAAIYFGAGALFRNVIQPIQENSQQIDALVARLQVAEDEQVGRTSDIITRLQALEVSTDRQKAALDEIQGRIDTLETAQEGLLETARSELTRVLDAAAEEQTTIKDDLENLKSELESLQVDLDAAVEANTSLQEELDAAKQVAASDGERLLRVEAEWAEKLAVIERLEHQLQLIKSIELLTRSRYHLVQNNLGLAQQDIQTAYDLLLELQGQLPEYQVETYDEILARVESAIADLPQKPVSAADNVDSAWNLLLRGLPDSSEKRSSSDSVPTPVSGTTPTPVPKP